MSFDATVYKVRVALLRLTLNSLPPGWDLETDRPATQSPRYRLTLPEEDGGGSLYIRWEQGRIHIGPVWPRGEDNAEFYPHMHDDFQCLSITVAESVSPSRLAGEILRRIVPSYKAARAVMMERVKGHDIYQRQSQAGRDALVALGGRLPQYSKESVYLTDNHVYQVSPQGESVRFEAFSCPLDVALRILELTKRPAV